ncbi:MAG: hypothetical protein BWZ10_01781 [candidate division BRC1 bacterium ADurb.BinA364]|nr:MAG: hypothetical protein BWZ10_01781 [candidate division BRC1 bacterium ADurb.BinA364]
MINKIRNVDPPGRVQEKRRPDSGLGAWGGVCGSANALQACRIDQTAMAHRITGTALAPDTPMASSNGTVSRKPSDPAQRIGP